MIYPIFAFSGTTNNKRQAEFVSGLMEGLNTPWAFVFGNHDQERRSKYGKNDIADVYMRGKNCLFQKGPENIDGVGNYIIEIADPDGSLNTALVFLDSHMYIKKGYFSGFDHVHDNQIEWYKEQITSISRREGRLIPSLMFFHLPIKEFSDAWRKLYLGRIPTLANDLNAAESPAQKEVVYHCGFVNEKDNYFGYPKTKKTHIFDDVLALGSTKGMFFGHDHLNTLSLTYKGVRLTYPMSIDYLAYFGIAKKNTQRGGTLIEIRGGAEFEITHIPLNEDCPMKKIKL
jgi:hypothetical protein